MTEPPTSPASPNEPEGTPPPPPPGAPGTSPYGQGPPGTSPYGAAPPYGAPPGQPAPYGAAPYGGFSGPPRDWAGTAAPLLGAASIPGILPNGLGPAALVRGMVAIPGILPVVLGILLGLLALIFGITGRKRSSRREATNGGAAMAGAILGGFALTVSIILVAVGATFFANHKSDIEKLRDCINNAQTQQQRQACQDQFQRDVTG